VLTGMAAQSTRNEKTRPYTRERGQRGGP
jgi:hypothetical protein